MACACNQRIIDGLIKEINTKHNQIKGLNSNITKCTEIKRKHEKFNEKLNCVITNLAENYTEPGKAYDDGKMTECLTNSKDTIDDCDDIIKLSKSKIILLEREILSLERRIASLDFVCSSCQPSTRVKK